MIHICLDGVDESSSADLYSLLLDWSEHGGEYGCLRGGSACEGILGADHGEVLVIQSCLERATMARCMMEWARTKLRIHVNVQLHATLSIGRSSATFRNTFQFSQSQAHLTQRFASHGASHLERLVRQINKEPLRVCISVLVTTFLEDN